jgi:hypothetical protein
MSEPVNFSEQLRVWRQSMAARAGAARETPAFADNVLPFRRELDARLEDEPNPPRPWLEWLRAEPWVPVIED